MAVRRDGWKHFECLAALLLILSATSGNAMAQEDTLRTIFCPIVSEAPTIDGVVTEEEWGASTVIDAMIPESINVPSFYDEMQRKAASSETEWEVLPPAPKGVARDTLVRLMADSEALYAAFVCGGPDGKPEHPRERNHDEVSVADDAVEVTLDLNHNHRDSMTFLAGYSGARTDIGHPAGRYDRNWDAVWESATHQGETSWSAEIAIPIQELTNEAIKPGRAVGIQLIRYRPGIASRSYLTLGGGRPLQPDLVFGPPGVTALRVAMPGWKQGLNRVRLKLMNHGIVAEEVNVEGWTASSAGEKVWETKTVSAEPGSPVEVELAGDVLGDSMNQFDLKVSRKDTGEQLYSATYHFSPRGAVDEAGRQWNADTGDAVRFQPEPFSVELTEAKGVPPDQLLRITTELTSRNSGEVIRTNESRAISGTCVRASGHTAGLPDGIYALRVVIADENGNELLESSHDFVCVGDEFGELKPLLAKLSQAMDVGEFRGAVFEEGGESLDFARTSFLFLKYLVEEAGKQIETGNAENYRWKLTSARQSLQEADKLANALLKGNDPLEAKTGIIQRAFISPYDAQLCPYTVFVPSEYDGSKPTPLVVDMLAPGPTPDWQINIGKEQSPVWASAVTSLEKRGFMMAWPRPTRRMKAEVNFFAVLEEMKKDYNIDDDRVYVMGASGGGVRTWQIGLRYPDQIAAIAPVSAVTICTDATERPWIFTREIVEELSAYYFPMNALHVPVIVLHGDADRSTRVDIQARPIVHKMRQLGLEVEYVEYPGDVHLLIENYEDAFDRAIGFFDRHRNVRHPKTIDFTTPSLRYKKAYWISIARFVQKGEMARVRAEAKGNTVEVQTDNIAAFTVLRDAEVLDTSQPVIIVIDGQNAFEGMFPETGGLGFVRNEEGLWQAK